MLEPEWLGTAFDRAIYPGRPTDLLRLRARALILQADFALFDSLALEQGMPASEYKPRLRMALDTLCKRSRSLSEWNLLARWIVRKHAGARTDSQCDAYARLARRAVHKRDKAARRYRHWLTLPNSRKRRNNAVKALAKAASPAIPASALSIKVETCRTQLQEINANDLEALRVVNEKLGALHRAANTADAFNLRALVRARVAVHRALVSSQLGARLQYLLDEDGEPAVWHTAGCLQTQLNARHLQAVQSLMDELVCMQLPLRARFGATAASALRHQINELA